MNANEAKELVIDVNNDYVKKELDFIYNEIKDRSFLGYSNCYVGLNDRFVFSNDRKQEIINILKAQGYKVSTRYELQAGKIIVDWT